MPNALITGSNRGLGLALVRAALAEGWRVYATARQPEQATQLRALAGEDRLSVLPMDLMDFASIDRLSERLDGTPIDVLLSNGAITGTKNMAFGETDYGVWADLKRANTMAPMRLAEVLVENVAASERKIMFFISSRIGPKPTFGYVDYRAAKSALSQVTLQIALALKDRGIVSSCAHPGWVATKVTPPPPGALSPEESARMLWRFVPNLTLADSGKFFDPDGTTLPIVTQQLAQKPYGMTVPLR
jgi:NAD(P)-dependent dehydrogenase (short-subunit alcohol dehydrogenase family)